MNISIVVYTNASFICKRMVKPKLEKYMRKRQAILKVKKAVEDSGNFLSKGNLSKQN